MSFKMKHKDLNNQELIGALKYMASLKMDFDLCWNLSGMIRQIENAITSANEQYNEMIEQFFEKDANGEKVPAMTKEVKDAEGNVVSEPEPIPGHYKSKEGSKPKMQEWLDKFAEMEVTIESYPIKKDQLKEFKISPNDLLALEAVMEEE